MFRNPKGAPVDKADKIRQLMALSECTHLKLIGGGCWIGVKRFAFTDAILLGHECDMLGYSNRWCYEPGRAIAAFNAWNGVGEPEGWHRHPSSGRRRPDGDPEREFIAA